MPSVLIDVLKYQHSIVGLVVLAAHVLCNTSHGQIWPAGQSWTPKL